MDRRDLLKLLSLATLAVTAAPLLTGCGDDAGPPRATDVELVAADVPRAAGDPTAVPEVVAAMHATGAAVLGSLAAEEPGNLAVSPYSVAVALALTANGAVGETRRQLELVSGGMTTGRVNAGLNALTAHAESLAGEVEKRDGTTTDLELGSANALFGQRGVTWQEAFLETLAASYGAGMRVVDWATETEQARRTVNAWTAEQTRDRVEKILPVGVVDASTRLVLVNTLYLKAPWETPFEPDLTEEGPFTLLDGTTVEVPLMTAYDATGDALATGEGWSAVRLPYAGGQVAMTVLVPDAGRFEEVAAGVVADGIGGVVSALEPTPVQVTLPRWTFRFHGSLVEPLRTLGVEVPFTGDADFSAMTTEQRLHVSGIEHEVFVAVDEEGTEAAAATAVVMAESSAVAQAESVVVDRPFLFVVHDVEHATPLFLGRVVDPRG